MNDDLTSFQRDCVTVIAALDEPCGLRIKEELEQTYSKTIDHSRLYQSLDGLVEKGYIDKEEADGRSNAYSLTPNGSTWITAFQKWTDQYRPTPTI